LRRPTRRAAGGATTALLLQAADVAVLEALVVADVRYPAELRPLWIGRLRARGLRRALGGSAATGVGDPRPERRRDCGRHERGAEHANRSRTRHGCRQRAGQLVEQLGHSATTGTSGRTVRGGTSRGRRRWAFAGRLPR
jgi:hypothetical protein